MRLVFNAYILRISCKNVLGFSLSLGCETEQKLSNLHLLPGIGFLSLKPCFAPSRLPVVGIGQNKVVVMKKRNFLLEANGNMHSKNGKSSQVPNSPRRVASRVLLPIRRIVRRKDSERKVGERKDKCHLCGNSLPSWNLDA